MPRIVLIGMPGAGKTTVGRRLALSLGVRFIDTDRLLQERWGVPVRVLLEREGREGFLRREEEAVLAMDPPDSAVISTGGSVVYSAAAMGRLRGLGKVVYLRTDAASLSRRTGDLRRRGVVAAAGTTLSDLLAERAPLYERYADLSVDASRAGPDRLVERIRGLLTLRGDPQ
jgi:shikimate kinase